MAKKKLIGIVVSTKQHKTITVSVQTRYSHPKYGKILVKTKRYLTHDEANECNCGDIVMIEESAPYSRHKTWKVKTILKEI